jgi:succinoglycan biosynthesis protein ExoA
MGAGPEVSIIMPVRNEASSLDATLVSVCSQATDASTEVIVVDDHSTDSTRSIIERWAAQDERVRLVINRSRGAANALNSGLEAARGRYIVRVDGHSNIPPDYVQALWDHMRSGACEGAGGQKHAVGEGAFGRAVAVAHGSRFGIGDSKYHYSQRQDLVDHIPFGAYVTERARAIGGWDEGLRPNEDYDFDFRYQKAGGRLLLDPTIVFDWRVRDTPARLAHQYYTYGRGKFKTLARHPSSLHLRRRRLICALPPRWRSDTRLPRRRAARPPRGARTRCHAPLLGNRLSGLSRRGGAQPHPRLQASSNLR